MPDLSIVDFYMADFIGHFGLYAVQGGLLYMLTTVGFDVVHYVLHVWERSRSNILRNIAYLHTVHHGFLDQQLNFNTALTTKNLVYHIIPETITKVLVTFVAWPFTNPFVVVGVLIGILIQVLFVWYRQGKDHNHIDYDVVPAPINGLFVGAAYHGMHHIYPYQYYSSCLTIFDRIFGTGCQLEGKTVALTGASGAIGAPLKELLEKEGMTVIPLKFGADYTYQDYSAVDAVLQRSDILILCHGAKGSQAMAANCISFIELIERFRLLSRNRLVPPEVWAVGSEIECHPAWGIPELQGYSQSKRAFAAYARHYYLNRDFLYRHIVPSAFTSPMGPGLISGRTAAKIALFWIRRGFRYVPVSYTGIAVVNFFKFLLASRKQIGLPEHPVVMPLLPVIVTGQTP